MAAATVASIFTIAASAYSIYQAATQKPPKMPNPTALPVDNSAKIAEAEKKRKTQYLEQRAKASGQGRSGTILTGANGLASEPQTQRKTLLGY